MNQIIDNFEVLRSHLDFDKSGLDRYIIHVLRRVKDLPEEKKNLLGSNEAQRLIKTYYIDSLDYFDKKKEAIIELCKANDARAYLIVQPKDNFDCLLNLGQKVLEAIRNKNYNCKPDHLIRQAFCECHKSRKKQWIIDLDRDEMKEEWIEKDSYDAPYLVLKYRVWTLEEVESLVKESLKAIGKSESDCYVVPTKNGWHIISSPFNLAEAQKKCRLLFEGVKKNEVSGKNITGWLHKDGMTVLWMQYEKEDRS